MPSSVPRPAGWSQRLLSGDRPVDVAVAVAATALGVSGAIGSDPTVGYDLAAGGVPLPFTVLIAGYSLGAFDETAGRARPAAGRCRHGAPVRHGCAVLR
jgi:hypothetical protein